MSKEKHKWQQHNSDLVFNQQSKDHTLALNHNPHTYHNKDLPFSKIKLKKMPCFHFITSQMTSSMEELLDASWCYESRETRDTNSSVTRPLDLVLITKCSGYFLSNISKPYHGFSLDSGPGHSSAVRYLLTRLWCQTSPYCSTNCIREIKLLMFKHHRIVVHQEKRDNCVCVGGRQRGLE